jgi:hypothetical protein
MLTKETHFKSSAQFSLKQYFNLDRHSKRYPTILFQLLCPFCSKLAFQSSSSFKTLSNDVRFNSSVKSDLNQLSNLDRDSNRVSKMLVLTSL